jgi:uroporphyrinogen decarboxylase
VISQVTPRERVLQALANQETDIVPYHIPIDPECTERLTKEKDAARHLIGRLDNHLPYMLIESEKHWIEKQVYSDDFGCVWKELDQVPHLIDPPLKEADLKEYHFPKLDFEKYFSGSDSFLESTRNHFRLCCLALGFFDRGWALRGFENFLSDVVLNQKFVEGLMDRLVELYFQLIDQIARYPFDAIRFADDWGYQRGITIGANHWRKLIMPGLERIFDYARQKNLTIMVHSDGDLTEIIPDLIQLGVQILNPIQPECMDILWLKREYGKHICFNGGISSQSTIPWGTPRQIQKEVFACIKYLGKDGGYIIGPTKPLNPDVPLENCLAVITSILNQPCQTNRKVSLDRLPDRVNALWSVYRKFHGVQ